MGGGGRIRESCLWCYLISPAREWASQRTPDARYQPLMTSEGDLVPRRHIATNTATAEHLKSSSRLSLTSQQLNLGDGKRAQSGEKSVPDDFLLLCSFSSALTPFPSSAQISFCPPFPSYCPPASHNYSHPYPTPATQRPSNHSVAHAISGACLASPPYPPSSLLLLPLVPPPPPSAFQHDKPHGISLVL